MSSGISVPDSYSKCKRVGLSPFPSEPSVAASPCRRFLARVKVEPPGDLEGTLTRANGSAALFRRDGRAAMGKGAPLFLLVSPEQERFLGKTSRWSFGRLRLDERPGTYERSQPRCPAVILHLLNGSKSRGNFTSSYWNSPVSGSLMQVL